MKKKIKIGVVGFGNISKKHTLAIDKNKQFEIAGVCDARNLDTKYNQYKNLDQMLKLNNEIDLISILSPSGYHFIQILKSLKNKKHVIVEKPVTMNLTQLKIIRKAEKKFKKKVFVVYQNRLNPLINFSKKKIQKKELGKIILFNASLYWNRDNNYFKKSKWRGSKELDGGVIMNQGIHNIDIFYNFFGKVKTVFCTKTKVKKFLECEDTSVISFIFKSGLIGSFSLSTAVNKENYSNNIEIFGVKNNIKLYGKNLNFLNFKNIKKKFNNESQLHASFYKIVGDCLILKKKNIFSTESTIHSMEIIDAIYKSLKFNTKINL